MTANKNGAKFDTIYVVEPGHKMDALSGLSKYVRFLTAGVELNSEITEVMEGNLSHFNPERDALIPVGRTFANFLAGFVLQNKIKAEKITIGIYRDGVYEFIEVVLNGG